MISILCPSRGRPEMAAKMVNTALKLAGGPLEILIYINDDDPKIKQYFDLIPQQFLQVGPDRSPVYSWNKLAQQARYDLLFLMGDDAWFETENWVPKFAKIFDQYPDKIAFVYPSLDGYPWQKGVLTADHCPHFIVHKNWVRALGYFVPPHFWHWYVDTWYRDVAKRIGRLHRTTDVFVPTHVDLEDTTGERKDRLSNRERDHFLWQHTQRWLQNDVDSLNAFINTYNLQTQGQR
jgi:hypothetical protein